VLPCFFECHVHLEVSDVSVGIAGKLGKVVVHVQTCDVSQCYDVKVCCKFLWACVSVWFCTCMGVWEVYKPETFLQCICMVLPVVLCKCIAKKFQACTLSILVGKWVAVLDSVYLIFGKSVRSCHNVLAPSRNGCKD
jgi:hypothetical protein